MRYTIEGYVEHIIFRNEKNGYTVLNLRVDGSELTCVGTFQYVNEGELLEASGEYTAHVVYGQQFRVEAYESKIPQDAKALERYLGSGAIKGVGAALAARIIRKFGENTLQIMEQEPERLAEIKGISERKAREITALMAEKSEMQSAIIFLSKYGISMGLGLRIFNKYGDNIYRILRENPYKIAEDIAGVGFKTADEIAARAGICADSEFRVRSGMYYVLSQASTQGHIYLPKRTLFARSQELLGMPGDVMMDKCLMDMAMERKIILKEEAVLGEAQETIVYVSQYYYLELNTARMLHGLDVICEEDKVLANHRIRSIEKNGHMKLDEIQRHAVVEAVCSGLMILTGGPGTGKTTTINVMIQYFVSEGLDILLAAPTGRAAKRMTEATGYESSTIHRLLELSGIAEDTPAHIRFERNAENPLEADVIIIDEMSMVDIHLMHALLTAVLPGTRLILVGDVNQLPSIGPGSVLLDMIRSECFRVVELTKIFRQAAKSDIVVNAHKIYAGEHLVPDNKSMDFFFLQRLDTNVILKVIVTLIQNKLPKFVDADPFDIQVLAPMRKGALGVENLNLVLQKYLNPRSEDKKEKETGAALFREGDKVMQVKNDYQMEWEVRGQYGIAADRGQGVFNGDLGVIRQINSFAELLSVEYDEHKFVDYTFKQLDELELAYATTIHKSQGSEYPAVILPLLGGPRMLMTRNLLYTAVTRARKCVTLVGSDATFQAMIDNYMEESRYTTLVGRIREFQQDR